MKVILQRVSQAKVEVNDEVVGKIDQGLMILFGAVEGDAPELTALLAKKVADLRIFQDENAKMNLSLRDVGGAALVVSQFTLAADCRKGRRPSFNLAAKPDFARDLYQRFCHDLRDLGVHVETGRFGEMMAVSLTNDGPVTIILDTDQLLAPRKKS